MVTSNISQASFGKRFSLHWVRWFIWITCLGAGYHGGQLIILAIRGALPTGLVIFITGLLGYVITGIVLGAIVGLIAAAAPSLRILPTTLLGGILRVLVIGLVFGVLSIYHNPSVYGIVTANASDAANPQSNSATKAQNAACFNAYAQGLYRDAVVGCNALALIYVPRLAKMRQANDEHIVLEDAYYMLRITYIIASAYKKIGDPKNGHQAALHCVGWGILVTGSVDDIDRNHSNPAYSSMRQEAVSDVQTLNKQFPGILHEESNAFKESNRP